MPQSPKITQLKNTALALFTQYGVRRVSVEEICRKAKVSKVTFYKYFNNRTDIATQVIDEVIQQFFQRMLMIKQDRSYSARLHALLSLELEISQELGEILFSELHEIENTDLKRLIEEAFERGREIGLEFFQEGQKAGLIHPNFTPAFFLFLMQMGDELLRDQRFKTVEADFSKRTALLQQFFMTGLSVPIQPSKINAIPSTGQ